MMDQVVDELFSYWTLEDSEDTLEQLEDLLIVRSMPYILGLSYLMMWVFYLALSTDCNLCVTDC